SDTKLKAQMRSSTLICFAILFAVLTVSTSARGMLRATSPDIQCREGCANCFAFEACMRNHIYEARYEDPHQVIENAKEDCSDICDRRFLFFVY
ncbi:hypothetical protein PRIPAC_94319, partial [Pristionchus pacificus]|uniref:Uncharacterized protein n=2 Tax=Pristionchus pacificus TaxID=54126 RepID=A0A2A6CUX4_PRIPA